MGVELREDRGRAMKLVCLARGLVCGRRPQPKARSSLWA